MDLGTVSAHKSSVEKPHRQKYVLENEISTEQQCVFDFSKDLHWLYLNDRYQLNMLHTTEWDAENKYEGSSYHVFHIDYPSISLRQQKQRRTPQ